MLGKFKKIIKHTILRNVDETEISKEELYKKQKEGWTIVDVRSPQEYREGHIEGAICIPDYNISKEIQKQIPDKKQKIILYCSSGSRSKQAKKILKRKGYENVYNLYGGIEIF
jgi:rhodanese-related sulfurtransferase